MAIKVLLFLVSHVLAIHSFSRTGQDKEECTSSKQGDQFDSIAGFKASNGIPLKSVEERDFEFFSSSFSRPKAGPVCGAAVGRGLTAV